MSITHPDASLRVSFTNCQKKRIVPSDDPLLDVFEESIPRSAPSASSKKYPDHCDRQSKSYRCSGFLCQVVAAVQA